MVSIKDKTYKFIIFLCITIAYAAPAMVVNAQSLNHSDSILENYVDVDGSFYDLDDDGIIDILITGCKESGGCSDPVSHTYYGVGDGSFVKESNNIIGVSSPSTEVDDINGDGNMDVVICGGPNANISTKLYYGNDERGFSDSGIDLFNALDCSISVADFNNNNEKDILVSGYDKFFVPALALYTNNGDGTFTFNKAEDINVIPRVARSSSAVADLDDDGNKDLIISGYDGNNSVTNIYFGKDDKTFEKYVGEIDGVNNGEISISDINEDGSLDFIITGNDTTSVKSEVYIKDGERSFSKKTSLSEGYGGSSVKVVDINQDGNKDIIASGFNDNENPSTSIYTNDGDQNFSKIDSDIADVGGEVSNPYSTLLSSNDFDSDGDLDVIVSGSDTTALYNNDIISDIPNESYTNTVNDSSVYEFGNTGTTLSTKYSGIEEGGNISVSRFDTEPSDTSGIDEENIAPTRYVINKGDGAILNDNTKLLFDTSKIDGVKNLDDVVVYSRPTVGSGSFETPSPTYTGSDTALAVLVDDFSEFAFASDSSPLPVELSSFEVGIDQGNAVISWQTVSETNNSGFAIQRKNPSGSWNRLGFVESKASGGTT